MRATVFSPSIPSANTSSFAVISLSPASGPALADAPTSVAHVPFDFAVGEITLHAGAYTVTRTERAGVVTMRPSAEASPRLLVQAIHIPGTDDPTPGHILFYRWRERYYLAQVLAQAE
jgi:hypothetical protein